MKCRPSALVERTGSSPLTRRPDANSIRRYKHKTGVLYGCENRSIPCEVLEEEFGRRLKLLTVNQEAIDLMAELAIQAAEVEAALGEKKSPDR